MFSAIYLSPKQKNRLNFFFIHFVWKQELLNARINTLRFHGAWFRKWSSIRNTEKNAHREEPKKSIGITVALNDDNDNKDDCRHLSVVCVAAKNELWPVQRTRVRKRERERECVLSLCKMPKGKKRFQAIESNQLMRMFDASANRRRKKAHGWNQRGGGSKKMHRFYWNIELCQLVCSVG